MKKFIGSFPHPVHPILTDNDGAFTDRLRCSTKTNQRASQAGTHRFEVLCAMHGIEHRLMRPYTPQTHGMAARFNRRISEALRQKKASNANTGRNKFRSHAHRNRFIRRFVEDYNKTRLKCLGYKAPLEVLTNQAGLYTKAGGI